jgi:hypothetical protein
MRMGERLLAAGQAMDEIFGFQAGESTRLLNASYALTIGMWQLKGCMGTERYKHLLDPKIARAFINEYPAETGAAMRTLWAGAAKRSP